MNTGFVAFDQPHHLGEIATHPLARLVARLPLYPQGVGRIRKAAKALKDTDPLRAEARAESYAATTPLSLLLAYPGRPRRRFALKDSDPLRAEARVESYAADTPPDVPSGASNCGF